MQIVTHITHTDWLRVGRDHIVTKKDPVRIKGFRGEYRFISHVINGRQEWVNVIHHSGKGGVRSVTVDRIKAGK